MSDPVQKQSSDFHTDMAVGEILRRAREHYGQSLDQVERNLRIRAAQIDAIENGDLSRLPGRVYAIGFVRSYSEYLGFDGDKMVHLFKRQSFSAKPESNLKFPEPTSESKLPAAPFAIVAALIGIIVIAVWAGSSSTEVMDVSTIPPVSKPKVVAAAPPVTADDVEVAAKPDEPPAAQKSVATEASVTLPEGITVKKDDVAVSPAVKDTVADAVAAKAAPPAVDQQKGIILNVTENSWVEIRDSSGKAIVARVLKAGDQYFVPDSPDLTMSLGNASGVNIVANGVEIGPLGGKGEVKRGISLNARTLKSLARKSR